MEDRDEEIRKISLGLGLAIVIISTLCRLGRCEPRHHPAAEVKTAVANGRQETKITCVRNQQRNIRWRKSGLKRQRKANRNAMTQQCKICDLRYRSARLCCSLLKTSVRYKYVYTTTMLHFGRLHSVLLSLVVYSLLSALNPPPTQATKR